ncbi:hypothetical protein AB1Y20_023235 [Prymnesium parvum]|uniref:EF-hand domain-containing protein n=1 Tax=Prymnesium parvum TaxID=97485 RepID=A0AB34JDI2_PRYPA
MPSETGALRLAMKLTRNRVRVLEWFCRQRTEWITRQDFSSGIRALGIHANEEDIAQLFHTLDADHSGELMIGDLHAVLYETAAQTRSPRGGSRATSPPRSERPRPPHGYELSPREGGAAPLRRDELQPSQVAALVQRYEAAVQAERTARESAADLVARQQQEVEAAHVAAANAEEELAASRRRWRRRLAVAEAARAEEGTRAGLGSAIMKAELEETELALRVAREHAAWERRESERDGAHLSAMTEELRIAEDELTEQMERHAATLAWNADDVLASREEARVARKAGEAASASAVERERERARRVVRRLTRASLSHIARAADEKSNAAALRDALGAVRRQLAVADEERRTLQRSLAAELGEEEARRGGLAAREAAAAAAVAEAERKAACERRMRQELELQLADGAARRAGEVEAGRRAVAQAAEEVEALGAAMERLARDVSQGVEACAAQLAEARSEAALLQEALLEREAVAETAAANAAFVHSQIEQLHAALAQQQRWQEQLVARHESLHAELARERERAEYLEQAAAAASNALDAERVERRHALDAVERLAAAVAHGLSLVHTELSGVELRAAGEGERQLALLNTTARGAVECAAVEKRIFTDELRRVECLVAQQTASLAFCNAARRVDLHLTTTEIRGVERRVVYARKLAVRAEGRARELEAAGEHLQGELEECTRQAQDESAAAARRESELRARCASLETEQTRQQHMAKEASEQKWRAAEAETKVAKLEAAMSSARAAARAAEAKLLHEQEQVRGGVFEEVYNGLLTLSTPPDSQHEAALRTMRSERDSEAKHRARAEAEAAKALDRARADAQQLLTDERQKLAEAMALAKQSNHVNRQAPWPDEQRQWQQEAMLSAELKLVEAQLNHERAKRHEEVSGLVRAIQDEKARWQHAAAEGWATASREAKRRHATQLARMSSALSSNVLTDAECDTRAAKAGCSHSASPRAMGSRAVYASEPVLWQHTESPVRWNNWSDSLQATYNQPLPLTPYPTARVGATAVARPNTLITAYL